MKKTAVLIGLLVALLGFTALNALTPLTWKVKLNVAARALVRVGPSGIEVNTGQGDPFTLVTQVKNNGVAPVSYELGTQNVPVGVVVLPVDFDVQTLEPAGTRPHEWLGAVSESAAPGSSEFLLLATEVAP